MANSYPILKMENISQVLLFSKYCLTLFFMFAWSFSWRKFSEFRMLYVCSSFYHIYSKRPWLLSKRKVRGPFVFPFSLLSSSSFFFFFFGGVYLHLLKYIQSTLKRNITLLHSWGIFLTGKLENKILSIFYLLQFKQKQTKLHFSQEQRSSHF